MIFTVLQVERALEHGSIENIFKKMAQPFFYFQSFALNVHEK